MLVAVRDESLTNLKKNTCDISASGWLLLLTTTLYMKRMKHININFLKDEYVVDLILDLMKDVKLTNNNIKSSEFLKFICCLLENFNDSLQIIDVRFITYFAKCMKLMMEAKVGSNLHLYANLIVCWGFNFQVTEWNEYMLNNGLITTIAISLNAVTNRLTTRNDDTDISITTCLLTTIDTIIEQDNNRYYTNRFLRNNIMHNLYQLQSIGCNDTTCASKSLMLKMGNWKLLKITKFNAV